MAVKLYSIPESKDAEGRNIVPGEDLTDQDRTDLRISSQYSRISQWPFPERKVAWQFGITLSYQGSASTPTYLGLHFIVIIELTF